jgi:hypothetical protein
MKKRSVILARLLAAAIIATTVVPSGMVANAATIVTTTSTTDAETSSEGWTQELTKANIGGEAYWHLVSSGTNNNNDNTDYSQATAPAIILDKTQDVTVSEDGTTTVSMDIYPNGTSSTMRFGVMVKYVDATHWAYLNYDVGSWYLEYNLGSGNAYPSISGLSGVKLTDYTVTNIKLVYTAAGEIEVTVTPEGSDPVTTTLTDAIYYNDDNEGILSKLETYAATAGEDGAAAPIYFGFKAGSNSGNVTDVNLKNMTLNGQTIMDDKWEWVVERDGQVFDTNDIIGGTNYYSLKAGETAALTQDSTSADFEYGTVSAILRPVSDTVSFSLGAKYTENGSVQVGYDGTSWYTLIGATKKALTGISLVPEKDKEYQLDLTISKNQKLTATVQEVAESDEDSEETAPAAVTLVSEESLEGAPKAGSVVLGTGAGCEVWVRDLNYTKTTTADVTALKEEYSRVTGLTGTENTDNKYYSDTWSTYSTALTNAKNAIDDSTLEIEQSTADTLKSALTNGYSGLVQVDKTGLQAKYDEVKATEKGLATDESWKAFNDVLDSAKAVLDKIDKKESVATTDVSTALANLGTAASLLKERAATSEEKDALKASYDYDALTTKENNNYTDATWTAYTRALETVKGLAESETATQTELKTALDTLKAAADALTETPSSAEERQSLTDLYNNVEQTKNDDYTTESWNVFQTAVKAAEGVILKGEAATQTEVQQALQVLQAAKDGLKKNAANAAVAFEKAAYTVDATATVETKVTGASAVTYTSSDASVATVNAKGVVTGVKAGKATITATANGVSATTVVTVTTPKIALTATSAKLQVKKSTKAIAVESKLASDSVVSWTSSNTKVATVTKAGKVKAKKTGKTTLTVTMKSGATATCKLTVQKGKVVTKSVKVASAKVTLNAGESYNIGAKRNPITATEKLTYATSNKKVATVSKKGVLTAKAKGTCKITVKCNGKKKVVSVTVK